ncbi:acetoacetate decarboxylase family protein [Nocardia sp. NPDC005366]|uniref:acetoacetate decarboxylase family protein n=1 Tax=Nocardia sp. NPDC005366 TaxID=3156878 RepID=UPI0033B5189F
MSTHTVLGQQVQTPVRIRHARAFMASYRVPADAAQRLIDYSGLHVLRVPRDRALCTLVFVEYIDGDLGPYNEFGVSFMVRHHTADEVGGLADVRALAAGEAGVFIHRLPVDGDFTLAAGRGIWGFPKELADFDVDYAGKVRRGILRQGGDLIVDLAVKPGLSAPARGAGTSFDAYSHIDGVTRCTQWDMEPTGMRARMGGVELKLGNHPMAGELAGLGLPTRAPMTSTVDRLTMTFQDAVPV